MYGFELWLSKRLGFVKEYGGIYEMTLKGAFYYHYYENFYTLSYIDKMRGIMCARNRSLKKLNFKSEGKSPSLLLCIGQNILFFVKYFYLKNVRNPSIYKALSDFCVIITRASIRRTIPVAFIIYISPFVYKLVVYYER